MKQLLILSLTLFSLTSFAQENAPARTQDLSPAQRMCLGKIHSCFTKNHSHINLTNANTCRNECEDVDLNDPACSIEQCKSRCAAIFGLADECE